MKEQNETELSKREEKKSSKKETERLVAELLKKGEKTKDIAKKTNKSLSSIYSIIYRLTGKYSHAQENVKLQTETRGYMIAYLVNKGYSQRAIAEILGTTDRTIRDVKKSDIIALTDDEIDNLIATNSNVEDYEKVQKIKLFVISNEKKIIEMLQKGKELRTIARTLKISGKELRGIIDKLVFMGKAELTEENRYVAIKNNRLKKVLAVSSEKVDETDKDDKKAKMMDNSKEDEKQITSTKGIVNDGEEIKRMREEYAVKCRNEIKVLTPYIKRGDISLTTKAMCFRCCQGIVQGKKTLTEQELQVLSEAIAYGEGPLNMESIRFVASEYMKLGNMKPAITLVNTCMNTYGESEQLSNARKIILQMNAKQSIINCLRKNMTIEQIMCKTGAREAEIISVRKQYFAEYESAKSKSSNEVSKVDCEEDLAL
jgi:DNA-binding NarL/FixJ family response regulator